MARKQMLGFNICIQDLIDCKIGNNRHIEFAQGSVLKVYVKFSDEPFCAKSMRSSYLGKTKFLDFYLKMSNCDSNKGKISISIHQVYSISFSMVQGLSLEQVIIDFDLRKQKSFVLGQIYTMVSKVKTYDNLYCIGEFRKSAIMANKGALL